MLTFRLSIPASNYMFMTKNIIWLLLSYSLNAILQGPYFIWPILLFITQAVSHEGRQHSSHSYANLLSAKVDKSHISILQFAL
jgi:hypothetical protein